MQNTGMILLIEGDRGSGKAYTPALLAANALREGKSAAVIVQHGAAGNYFRRLVAKFVGKDLKHRDLHLSILHANDPRHTVFFMALAPNVIFVDDATMSKGFSQRIKYLLTSGKSERLIVAKTTENVSSDVVQ